MTGAKTCPERSRRIQQPGSTLKIYNLLGQGVRRLVHEPKEPGYDSVPGRGRIVTVWTWSVESISIG